MYFCDRRYIDNVDSIKRIGRSIQFKGYENLYKNQQLSISSTLIEKFKKKLENKKLLAIKMVKFKIQFTTNENIVILTIERR